MKDYNFFESIIFYVLVILLLAYFGGLFCGYKKDKVEYKKVLNIVYNQS